MEVRERLLKAMAAQERVWREITELTVRLFLDQLLLSLHEPNIELSTAHCNLI
jgi:hypothetical protein